VIIRKNVTKEEIFNREDLEVVPAIFVSGLKYKHNLLYVMKFLLFKEMFFRVIN